MKKNLFNSVISTCFFALFFSQNSIGQTTVTFNEITTSSILSLNGTNTYDNTGVRFQIFSGSNSGALVSSSDIGFNSTKALDDTNLTGGGVTGWKITKVDGSDFQLLSIWLQNGDLGVADDIGTVKAYKDGNQIGATVNVNFDSRVNGAKIFSSNPNFYDVDEIRIEGGDLYVLIDNFSFGPALIPLDEDPPLVTNISLVGSPLTTATSVSFTVNFSKNAINVDSNDFQLTTAGTTGTIGTVTGSGNTYTVQVNNLDGEGTIRLDLKSLTDIANEDNISGTPAYTSGQFHYVGACFVETFETETDAATTFSGNGVNFSLGTGLEIERRSGFGAGSSTSYVMNNNTAGSFSISSGTEFSMKTIDLFLSDQTDGFNPTGTGTVTITGKKDGLDQYTITKASGFPTTTTTNNGFFTIDFATSGAANYRNTNVDELVFTISGGFIELAIDNMNFCEAVPDVDSQAPVVQSINKTGNPLSTSSTVNFQVTFDEAASNVTIDDFTLLKTGTSTGTITGISGTGSVYTLAVTGISGEGSIQIKLNAATDIEDALGNTPPFEYLNGEIHLVGACYIETFETFADGSTSFSSNGKNFTLGGNWAVKDRFGFGINSSNGYIENTGTGAPFTLTVDSPVTISRLALFLTSSSVAPSPPPTNDGSVTIRGKNGVATAYTITKSTGFPTDLSSNNGFFYIDFATEGGIDNSSTYIDGLEIEIGGAFIYLGLDNLEFCSDFEAPSGYSVTIDQDPIREAQASSVSFTFVGAELNATYNYTFSSTGGGTSVVGSGTISSATQQVTGIDLSGLGEGTVSLSVKLTDPSGNEGDPATDTAEKMANNAPVVTAPTSPVVIEDTPVDLANDIQVSDVDGDDQTVSFTITGGILTIGTTDITFGGSLNGSNSFTASGGLAAINTALDEAVFTPTPDLNGVSAGSISFISNDGIANSNTATVTFDIAATNDPPVVDYNGSLVAFWTEGDSPVMLNPNILISDPENDIITAASIRVVDFVIGDVLSISSPEPYSASFDTDTGILTLSGTGTEAQMQAVLRTVGFSHTTDDPGQGDTDNTRAVNFQVTDENGANSTQANNIGIGITSVNDDPSFVGLPIRITVEDGIASNVDLSAATFEDVDSGLGNVTLSFLFSGGTLSATSTSDVSVSFPIPGSMNLVGTATAIESFLNIPSNIQYTNALGSTGDNAATLSLSANDNGNTGTGGGTSVSFGTISIDVLESPKITSVTVPANGTYTVGQELDFTVNFSEQIDVNTTGGRPGIILTIGSTDYDAVYLSGSGSSALLFRYTVQIGDLDLDGISIANLLSLNGGSIQSTSGDDAILTLNGVGSTTAVLVDAVAPTGYSVEIDQDPINNTNAASVSFRFTSAEIGASYNYEFSSSGGGSSESGTGTITTSSDQITGIDLSGLPDGTITLIVRLEDGFGNLGVPATDTKIKDTQPPAKPSAPDLVSTSDSGISDTDDITNDVTPTLEGVAEANSTISVSSSIDGVLGTTVTDGSGQWSFTPLADLSTGIHSIAASISDIAGNSNESDPLSLTIDTKSPTPIVINGLAIVLDANGNSPTLTAADLLASPISDDLSDPTDIDLELDKSTFDCSNVGNNLVRVTATDEAGNSDFAEIFVLVQDFNAPTILAKTSISLNVDAFGTVELLPGMIDEGSTDACGIQTQEFSQSIFDRTDEGLNNITYTVTDTSGNPAQVDVAVTIVVVPKVLIITADPGQSKILGAAEPEFTYDASGFAGTDDETILTGSLSREAGETVGSYEITLGDLSAGPNYTIDFVPADFEIKKGILKVEGTILAVDKVYDGTRSASFQFASLTLIGVDPSAPNVLINDVTTEFVDKNVGVDKEVRITSVNLTGANAASYDIDYSGSPTSTATISPRALAVTGLSANNKLYDGTTQATLSGDPLVTVIGSDEVSVIGTPVANFTQIGVGTGIPVNVTGLILDGADKNNYNIVQPVGLEADITEATLSIIANPNQSKILGTADPVFSYSASGFVGTDTEAILTGALTRVPGEDVGAYPITLGTVNAGANYTIDYTGADFTISKKTLTITVDAGQSKTYGDADPSFSYEASGFENGDDESILTGALARIDGEEVGIYPINLGTLGAGTNYTINFIGSDFDITPSTLTVTADAGQNKVYGGADPTFTYHATGFKNGDDESILTGTLARTLGENVGTYTITLGTLGAGDNYTIVFTGSDFEIIPATLTITADAGQSKTYGDSDPTLTYEAIGFKNGDDESILTGALSRSTGENVGTYAINMGTLDAGANYTIAYTGADFAITVRMLPVIADANQGKIFGEADPTLTYTASNFGNGDDESILTGSLARSAGENVGNYAINLGTLSAGDNYIINYTAADFVITEKILTITVTSNQSKVYGDADPTFTYMATGFERGDDESILTGELARAAGENVGTYAITPGDLSAGDNYTINYIMSDFEITKKALTITADDKQKVYGEANPVLTFSYDGLVNGDTQIVTLPSITTTATASSNVGTYPITLSGGSDANYSITLVNGTLTIGQKALTITADDKQKIYGEPNPTLTFTYSGLVNGDTQVTTEPSIATTATASSNAGSYPITLAGGSDVNYSITLVNGTLTIGQKAVTITADEKQKIYGEANPALTFTYSGLVNGDTQVTTEPSIATTATASSNAGSYPIALTGGSDQNYAITLVNGTLTIGKKDLTITADDKQKTYGEENPTLTFTYSGLVNGDTQVTTEPSSATTATTSSNVGTYPITLSGGSDQNYAITLVNGTLTIGQKALTITADDKQKIYGEANPTLTFTYNGLVTGDTQVTTEPNITTTATASSNVGSNPITLSGGSDQNYAITLVNGTLTIGQKALTITADDKQKIYGESNPTLTFTYSGLVNGDTQVTTEPNITTTATASSNVGSYPITLSGGTDQNYSITLVNGTLTINQAILKITAEAKSKIFGNPDPSLTFTSSGFKLSDTEAILTGSLIREQGETVGVYSISLGTLDAGANYLIEFQGSELEIIPAELAEILTGEPITTPWSVDPVLPTQVSVLTQDGQILSYGVTWDKSTLNLFKRGTYTVFGTVNLPADVLNPSAQKAVLQVIVLPKPAPTDINLSNNQFVPNSNVFFQDIGFFTVIDEFDDIHTVELVLGAADNVYFEIKSDILFWSSADEAAGMTQFNILVRVTDRDGNVIEKSFTILRDRKDISDIEIFNTFSPDGDGVNDTWGVPDLKYFAGGRVQVFDRSGQRVFYTESPAVRWDGTFEGKELPVGAYFWILESRETGEIRRGVLNLLRQ